MRARFLFALLLGAGSLAGCAGLAPQIPGASGFAGGFSWADASIPAAVPISAVASDMTAADPQSAYTLDAGDKLRVTVFGQDGITNNYVVDAGGNVMLPLVGPVRARGLTTRALSGAIAERLRSGFIREPHVAVEIESYRPFFILGEVTAPGQYPFVPNMTAETAVAIAGGFTPRASRSTVRITRAGHGGALPLAAPLTTPLRPGDTLTVEERWF